MRTTAYHEKGKLINNIKELQINDLKIKLIPEGDSYKYLGIDEYISYVELVNKTRVTKEYYTRVKRLSNSDLSSVNKVIAHNLFPVPELTTTAGILNWTIDEIREIDIKTQKQLAVSKNLHPKRDRSIILTKGTRRTWYKNDCVNVCE